MLRSRTLKFFFAFGLVFTLLSIPFISGMMRPSFSGKNPYALFYAFFDFPVTAIFGGLVKSLADSMWDDAPTLNQLDTMSFFVSLAFWSLLGAVIGWVNDMRGGRV
ncbi:MAG TPA: hypothetical protein VL633_11725 [Bacteroidota bacterium]|jgi:hypothetical protein|nr:hypothetical protein [Bacteroidota bacterium]